jgi:hypothetical protein
MRASDRGNNRLSSDHGINRVSSDRGTNRGPCDRGINRGACERGTNKAPAPGQLLVPVDKALLGVLAARALVRLKVPQVALDVGPRER